MRFHDVFCYPQLSKRGRIHRIFGNTVLGTAISLCTLTNFVHGALTLSEVLDRMGAQQKTIQDVTFKFDERIQRGDFPADRISGVVEFKQPHALKVLQKVPDAQVLISNGTTFWLYSPAQQQELTGNWPAWVKQSHFPLPLLDWVGTLSPDRWKSQYTVLFGGYQDSEYELHFKPNRAGDWPLTLWVSERNFLPLRGSMQQEGITIQVTLQAIKINTGLKEENFTPNVPAGTTQIPVHF